MTRRASLVLVAWLVALCCATAAVAAPGSTSLGGGAPRAGRAIIERIGWETFEGRGRLVIAVKGALDYTVRAAGADPASSLPHRAYVDLRPAVLGKELSRAPIGVDDPLAERIRVGQFDPETVRIVVDLRAPGLFEVRTSERPPRLLLTLMPRTGANAPATRARIEGAPAGSPPDAAPGTTTAQAPRDAAPARAAASAASVAAQPPPAVPAPTPIVVARAAEPTAPPTAPPAPRTPEPTAMPTPSVAATTAPQHTVAAPAPLASEAAIVAVAPKELPEPRAAASARDDATSEALAERSAPAPRRTPPARQAAKPLRTATPHVWTVVLDPGHGGRDPGARGVTGHEEKDITLAVAQMVAERLTDDPQIRVVLTRSDDSYVSLEQRTAIANAQGADLFISIHANASDNPNLAGIETYTLNNTDDRATIRLAALENGLALTGAAPGERDLAYILSDLVQTGKEDESVTLARAVQGNVVSYLRDRWRGVVNLGVKKGPFYVLVGAYMPCMLIEVAFLTNETEGQRIAARRYQQDVADGIAQGVRRFLATEITNSNL